MERRQTIDLVRNTFTQSFDEARFTYFVRNLVNHLDESKKQTWTLKKAAFQDYVNHFMRLGTYTDPRGERVDVLIIYLRKETTLARGRVTLRNFVADYMTTGHGQGKAAVISAFVSPSEDDWRFSFVKLDSTFEKTELGLVVENIQLTPARRYSYLVGRNENCHTAQKQFLELLQADYADPTVVALEAAFSVEKVTEEFFEHYRELFEKSRDALKVFLRSAPILAQEFEERGITIDDFAKKLLGQIVFLYFLQKKGWFGVERDQHWGQGPKNYLRIIFNDRERLAYPETSRKKRAPNFFNDVLEPLFYDALSNPREADNHFHPFFGCRIPFLNGGLFEPLYGYRWVETEVLFPDSLFSNSELSKEGDIGTGILDVFDRYNFTVNEAEPLEKEVAVDPEMLGKVFENLLPENIRHSSGTYYTPRIIVHYMCQQALLHYVAARADDIPQEDLTVFLRLAERFADFESRKTKAHSDKRLPESIRRNAGVLDGLLADITVCDPAIGSGAFLVGMMHEIVRARMALTPEIEEQGLVAADQARTPYTLKRHAIHHSLYGVDEDPGAVEIAKLRLWLSMVVDEDEINDIQPLPNLDYKIMQGNSLFEEFDGIRLFDDRHLQQPNAAHDEEIAWIRKRLIEVEKKLFQLYKPGHRKGLSQNAAHAEIKKLQKRLAILLTPQKEEDAQGNLSQQESWASLNRIQQLHSEFFNEVSRVKKDKIRAELDRMEWNFMRTTLREQGREQALVELEKASTKHRKPFFIWRLQFGEVFRKKGGFDVLIANPPYVRQEMITELKPALQRRYKTYSGRCDLYVYFYELAISNLAPDGVLAFISSNKFFRANYGSNLRNMLTKETSLKTIIDFEDAPVFEATVYPSVIILQKTANGSKAVEVATWSGAVDIDYFVSSIKEKLRIISQNELVNGNWSFQTGIRATIYSHINGMGEPLGKMLKGRIFAGIKTGLNEAFIIDADKRNELIDSHKSSAAVIKPFLKGKDIGKWAIRTGNQSARYIIYMPHGIEIDEFPAIKKHLSKFKSRLEARALSQKWYELQQPQLAFTSTFQRRKIVYPNVSLGCRFALDEGSYLDMTAFCLATDDLYILAVINSSVMTFYFSGLGIQRRGGYQEFKTQYVRQLPIPKAGVREHEAIVRLVEYLQWLHRNGTINGEVLQSAGLTLLTGYFEQWINALVYELFFPEQLHKAGLYFSSIAEEAKLNPISEMKGRELTELHVKFEELYASNHPLRQSLFALDSIEEVRIIEGKA